ncbi:MAG: stage 0 sporulation family protein [Candidatus Omnitrophota bacterium]
MHRVIEVKKRESGKILYFEITDCKPKTGDYVIVESDRGLDYGQVLSGEELFVKKEGLKEPIRKVVRIADKQDVERIEKNFQKSRDIMKTCSKKIQEHKLNMKLIDAELSFDCSKIVFFFTAEERVDFRDLVKDLAKIFRARIELRQVGVRDEAKMFGGLGPCGRGLCCTDFLKDFEPVTIKMAKDQNLPLNPAKISGVCGRLMCCLSYEHRIYKDMAKGLPKMGQKIKTADGQGKVMDVNFLKRMVVIELEDGRQLKLVYPREVK